MNQQKSLVGDLNSMPITDVFQWIAMSNRSGELFLQKESEEVSIIFKNGMIVYSSSNMPKFLLGQLLLRYKMIGRSNLLKGLAIQKQLKHPLGQLLVDNKYISSASLEKIVSIQISEIIYHIIEWSNGFFRFIEKEINVNTQTLFSVDSLILEGLRRKDELNKFLALFTDKSVCIIESPEFEYADFFDGTKSIGEIIKEIGNDSFHIYYKIYEAIKNKDITILSEKDFNEEDDPVIKFLVSLELFNKGKIYESYKTIVGLVKEGIKNEQVSKFYENLVIYISRYFYKKFGGESACFAINRMKLLDEKIYISPVEGFVLSRVDEFPCIKKLEQTISSDKIELFLIIDKLYKLGLLLLKEQEKNKTELMSNDIFMELLNVYKREITGVMEVVSKTLSCRIFFENGKIVFIHSNTEEYGIKKFITDKNEFFINEDATEGDIESFIISIMEKNNLSIANIKSILKIYQDLIFFEVMKSEIISIIFINNRILNIDIKYDFNLIYMLTFTVINQGIKIKNELDNLKDYELISEKRILINEFEDLGLVNTIIEEFNDNIFSGNKLKKLNNSQIDIMNIFYQIGYIKEIPKKDTSSDEIKKILDSYRNKKPEEIFEVDDNNRDLEVIKQKYLKFSKKFHPDLYTDHETKSVAQELFEIIKYSYDSLIKNEQSNSKQQTKRVDIKKIFLAEQFLTSGKVYLNMGRLNDAIDSFEKAYENFHEDDEIELYHAFALIKKGKPEEGYKIMYRIGLGSVTDYELYFACIEAQLKTGKHNEARKTIDNCIAKFPDQSRRINNYKARLK